MNISIVPFSEFGASLDIYKNYLSIVSQVLHNANNTRKGDYFSSSGEGVYSRLLECVSSGVFEVAQHDCGKDARVVGASRDDTGMLCCRRSGLGSCGSCEINRTGCFSQGERNNPVEVTVGASESCCVEGPVQGGAGQSSIAGVGIENLITSDFPSGYYHCCKERSCSGCFGKKNVSEDIVKGASAPQEATPSCSSGRIVTGNSSSDNRIFNRGVNWERNQQWRKNRKDKKKKRQMMNIDWRKRDIIPILGLNDGREPEVTGVDVDASSIGKSSSSGGFGASHAVQVGDYKRANDIRSGFFSECDVDTRRRLRESRAAALVAKNELDAARSRQQLGDIEKCSPQMALAKELIRVTAMANKLKRNTKDQEIGGWAKTVADNLTKSVADSAPSSVPSLESVGYGKSGLKSSDGSFIEVDRLRAYNAEMAQLECDFDAAGLYSDIHYEAAVASVKEKYADIAYTGEENFRRKYNEELIDKLLVAGLSPATVDDILGIDYEVRGVPRYAPGMEPDNDAYACILRNSRVKTEEDAKLKEERHLEMCRKAAFDNGFDRNNTGKI